MLHLSVTIDIWTNRDLPSYLGMTCHYIQDFQLKSSMLACTHFHGRHTTDNIHEEYQSIIEQYELKGKVSATITDNASNMIKCFSLPGMEMFSTIEDQDDYDVPVNNEEVYTECDPDLLTFLPEHFGCFCHTLQLIVKAITKIARLFKHVRHFALASKLLEEDCKLVMACATRWNI